MRSLLLALIACAALTILPTTSGAKGIAGVHVCGADGCHAVDDAAFHADLADGRPVQTPVAASPFVTVQVSHDAPGVAAHTEHFTYLPSLGLVRAQGAMQWIKLYPRRRGEIDGIVAAARPLPAAQLSGVVQPAAQAARADGPWWPRAGAGMAALALLALLARYATSALKARPRASGSAP